MAASVSSVDVIAADVVRNLNSEQNHTTLACDSSLK